MKIHVKSLGLTPHEPLAEHLEKKLNKLDTYYDKIIDCKVFLKVENSSEKQNKTAEIIVAVPGEDIVVKKTSASFEESLDLCTEVAKKLLIKKKELA
ncbi:MAG: ribosome-associated translation inhibitor RaiA [Chryseobacterium sp.]|nr:ribosome-associated translation inhibitor RaiA [Chryseobacterium sp.]